MSGRAGARARQALRCVATAVVLAYAADARAQQFERVPPAARAPRSDSTTEEVLGPAIEEIAPLSPSERRRIEAEVEHENERARERTAAARRGLHVGIGAELLAEAAPIAEYDPCGMGYAGDRELLYGGPAFGGSLRYGFGIVALEASAHVGVGYIEASRYSFCPSTRTPYESEEGLAPEVGARGGVRFYLGTLPVFLGLYGCFEVVVSSEFGAVSMGGGGMSAGVVLDGDHRWELALRVGMLLTQGVDSSVSLVYWL